MAIEFTELKQDPNDMSYYTTLRISPDEFLRHSQTIDVIMYKICDILVTKSAEVLFDDKKFMNKLLKDTRKKIMPRFAEMIAEELMKMVVNKNKK